VALYLQVVYFILLVVVCPVLLLVVCPILLVVVCPILLVVVYPILLVVVYSTLLLLFTQAQDSDCVDRIVSCTQQAIPMFSVSILSTYVHCSNSC